MGRIFEVPSHRFSAIHAPVTEGVFEQRTAVFRLLIPFLFIAGAWVQGKKFFYRAIGGEGCVPKTNLWLFDGLSINGRKVKDGAARWPALDAVYNFRTGEGTTCVHRTADTLWLQHLRNAQAVRNRLRIVKRELALAILKVAEASTNDEPVRILSIAAGSGQGVIEVVRDMQSVGIRCELTLVDIDTSALAYAKKLAALHRIDDSVTTYEGRAASFYKSMKGFKPDIIEMCGLMDYLRDTMAVALVKKIHQYLRPEGFFLTCHIHPNAESYFLRHGINWDMLYRTRGQLLDLINQGGFLETKLYTEPLRIHSVAVSQKV